MNAVATNRLGLNGLGTLYRRRIGLIARTREGIIIPLTTPILFALLIAPALDSALGTFNPAVDYMTFVAIATAMLMVPLSSMFNGTSVIVDHDQGVTPELLVAPIRRWVIPFGNALAVLTIAALQVVILISLSAWRGAEFDVTAGGLLWFGGAIVLISLATYAVAETLAHLIGKQQQYIDAIPLVAIVPWFFAGSLFPIGVLPAPFEVVAKLLPQTHALALLRHGLIEDGPSGLHDIWGAEVAGISSEAGLAALSLAVVGIAMLLAVATMLRVFARKTMS
jgi:lipooligosaccharide transport system permease protein